MHRSVARGIALIVIALAVIIGLLILPKHASKNHPPNDDPWVLVSYDPDNPYGTYLGNGFISCRIMGEGVGNHNGQPLPCYMAGLYDDEKLIPTPTWSDLRFYDGKTEFKIDKEADYKQVLNMKTSILTTYATWRAGRKTLKGKIEVIVSRSRANVGMLIVYLVPNFTGPVRAESDLARYNNGLQPMHVVSGNPMWWRSVRWRGNTVMFAFGGYLSASLRAKNSGLVLVSATSIGSDDFTFVGRAAPFRCGNRVDLELKRDCNCVVISCASLALGKDETTAALAAESALKESLTVHPDKRVDDWTNVAELRCLLGNTVVPHKLAMADLWKHDIIIDGPKRDQQALHSCMFYLLQSVREGSEWSIPPMGLSNNAFSGHVFWDAETWMFPALILQHPELAKSIVDYRYKTLPGAMANAKAHGFAGAEYAWESGYTGKEDTPEGLVYRYERHINGDIALCQWQYFLATGDLNWLKTRGYPVLKATADYWVSRVKWVPEKNRYEILQVVPPDENADLINNSAYTNIIAQMNLRLAQEAAKRIGNTSNPKWAEVAEKIYIPYDASKKRFIAFDGYQPNWKAKQADAELIIYPLQYNIPGQDMTDIYKNTFDYYSKRVHPNGPAMITSAYSVIAARFGDCDRAYKEFVKSYKPYFRGPFNYFNEKASTTYDNTCFLTGAAGPIQSTIFGLAGANTDYFAQDSSQILNWSPCLPKQWKSLKLTGVHWRGKTFDVIISQGNKIRTKPPTPNP